METYGFTLEEWEEAKTELRESLIERARVRGQIPYSEAVQRIHAIRFEPHDQRFFHMLGQLSSEEDTAGRGMLSAVVVHKHGDMQPGPGFFELAKTLGRDTSDILKCWVDELRKVHAQWSK